VRALVERDPEIRALLKTMRKELDLNVLRDAEAAKGGTQKLRPGNLARQLTQTLSPSPTGRDRSPAAQRRFADGAETQASERSDPSSEDDTSSSLSSLAWERIGGLFFGPALHPDGRFRSVWNVILAILICYCGVSVPLEICFDTDMTKVCVTAARSQDRKQCVLLRSHVRSLVLPKGDVRRRGGRHT